MNHANDMPSGASLAAIDKPATAYSERTDRPPGTAIIPRATYRVQFHLDFGFAAATALVPYWAALGISHLYCSPPLRARPGSQHGYDVVNHGELNPELGTLAEFDSLVDTLHAHDMGLLVDIVPNHMGVLGADNAWWLDVLENGAASAYAETFDIDWRSPDPALTGRVLLPILGDQYGVVLERGELQLGFDAARGYFTLSYYEHRMPADPSGYGALLRRALLQLSAADTVIRGAATQLAAAFEALPPHDTPDGAARLRRQRDQPALKARLSALVADSPGYAQAIGKVVSALNGHVGDRRSFDTLDELITAQAYRLSQWRVAADEINYRRFFDINELAALKMERPDVFEATHRLMLQMAAKGQIDGMRIDHPDGLADPAAYFMRLQRRYAELAGLPPPLPGDEHTQPQMPLYVVVEKIVAPHEQVPRDWAVHGTTGYRYANVVNGLMVDGAALKRLDRTWRAFVGDEAEDFEHLSWHCRHIVMDGTLAGELTVLANHLLRLAREDRRTRDFTFNILREALSEVVASFPVYRTYIVDKPSRQDRKFIDWAIGRARRHSVAADASVFDFLRRILLGRPLVGAPPGLGERYRAFARRLQQYTAPVVAKGIEDTALYRHNRLISLNDVGGEPDDFGISVAAFHAINKERSVERPAAMLATSTHDAKRSEDVRLRIDVISEMPAAWRLTVRRWSRLARSHKRTVDGARAPSRNDEYLLYQMLVGSLPVGELNDEQLASYTERIEAAMLKSARESKAITSWMNPNPPYEEALSAFVRALLTRRESNLFLPDLQATTVLLADWGALNGLTLAVMKGLSPGVPDYYQGHEAIELSLVDPDNRRPVDYERRRALLAQAEALAALLDRSSELAQMLPSVSDGRAKFYVNWCALQLRKRHGPMLRDAEYLPLEVRGERAAHGVAFARRSGSTWLVAVGTRLPASMGLEAGQAPVGRAWGDTVVVLPAGTAAGAGAPTHWRDAISGTVMTAADGALRLDELLRDFPVALLESVN